MSFLPPKAEFEQKIKEILIEAKERLERRKSLPKGKSNKRKLSIFMRERMKLEIFRKEKQHIYEVCLC